MHSIGMRCRKDARTSIRMNGQFPDKEKPLWKRLPAQRESCLICGKKSEDSELPPESLKTVGGSAGISVLTIFSAFLSVREDACIHASDAHGQYTFSPRIF